MNRISELSAMRKPLSRDYALLVVVTIFAVVIKAFDPVRSPVVGALDPWGWTDTTRQFLATGQLSSLFTGAGYPPTFMYTVAAIASFGVDPYEVIRYIPIAAAFIVVPIYLLTLDIFDSHAVAALTALLTVTARYHFMRTSIGIPEGLSYFFLVLTLFLILRSLKSGKWIYRATAATSMTIAVLYYHFTLIILIPFFCALPFLLKADKRTVTVKILGSIVIPSALAAGALWYFQVVGQIVAFYFGTSIRTYQVPTFERSLTGFLQVLAYSIGKTGAIALSNLGYMMAALGLLGFACVVFFRAKQNKRLETSFLVTYLLVLAFLTVFLWTAYSLGLAGAGDSSVYMFSWLTMPVAAFASYGIMVVSGTLWRNIKGASRISLGKRQIRAIAVAIVILVCLINLSAVNYYKAWDGNGLGVLKNHYYYKCMTDEEYYALAYIRDNTASDSMVLTVGVDSSILTHHATVSQRTMISVTNVTVEAGNLIADLLIVYPEADTPSRRVSGVKITLNGGDGGGLYFIEGIRKVSVDVARKDGSPPLGKTLMETVLMNEILSSAEYGYVYHNEQVTVLLLSHAVIEIPVTT